MVIVEAGIVRQDFIPLSKSYLKSEETSNSLDQS